MAKAYGEVNLDPEDELTDNERTATPPRSTSPELNKLPATVPHETYRPNDPKIDVPHETYRPDNRKRTAEIVNSNVTLKKRVLNMAPDGTPVRLPSTAYLRTIPSPIIHAPHMLTFVQPDPAVLAMYLAADKKSK